MDHPVPAPDALVRPWRTATLVLTAVALAELVLLLGAGAVLLGRSIGPGLIDSAVAKKPQAVKAAPTPAPTPARAPAEKPRRPQRTAAQPLAREETSVLVLNGNGRQGAAAQEAQLVAARAYRVSGVGDARHTDYARNVVMYRPGYRAEGARLARDLGIRIVTPLDGMKPAELGGAQLALVIGND